MIPDSGDVFVQVIVGSPFVPEKPGVAARWLHVDQEANAVRVRLGSRFTAKART